MNGFPDCDDMGLAKDHKLQRELDRENRDLEINRAMAEVVGWSVLEHDLFPDESPHKWIVLGPSRNPSRAFVFPDESVNSYLPDFLSNLNAVHEVIMSLLPSDQRVFAGWLYLGKNCSFQDFCNNQMIFDVAAKNARQRCEAILKTLSRWNPEWDHPI